MLSKTNCLCIYLELIVIVVVVVVVIIVVVIVVVFVLMLLLFLLVFRIQTLRISKCSHLAGVTCTSNGMLGGIKYYPVPSGGFFLPFYLENRHFHEDF